MARHVQEIDDIESHSSGSFVGVDVADEGYFADEALLAHSLRIITEPVTGWAGLN
jgi:hypothetical protein